MLKALYKPERKFVSEIPPLSHWPLNSSGRHPAETALVDQWPDARLGRELAAIAQATQQVYQVLLGHQLRRDAASRIRDGKLDTDEWPAAYGPYDPVLDYVGLCKMAEQRHEGMRHALLAALRVREDAPSESAELILLSVALSRDPAAPPAFT
ncbi:hypothetical protein ADK91_03020 [Streptomyces sp. XY511]|uniref:hypothetical protein n=1 Tax=Streptomyces sp. XY511 TaxID=1519480 RepID=UPI0006AF221F|nr:hypothetical protein [Streptomyces sp. XY511]KOV17163.1 hypothetical protein ADK91_03020 [Streptomyces sp. XY511]